MDLPPGYARTDVTEADRADIEAAQRWAFADPEPPADEPLPPVGFVDERTTVVRETSTGEIAATATSLPFTVEVPGGARAAVGGLSDVAVHPSHRRRGLARAVLVAHLRATAERGELFSMLVAAEAAIYGRYGYGCATTRVALTIPRGAALRELPVLSPATGDGSVAGEADDQVRVRFELADAARHTALVAEVHAAAGRGRAGWALREGEALAGKPLHDPPSGRGGRERLKIAIASSADDRPLAYALFSRRDTWEGGNPAGTVIVTDSATTTAASARALWGAVTDLDLMSSTEIHHLPPDDALLHLLVDARAAAPRLLDNTWVRLVDVPAALAARRYASDVDVVLAVTDALLAGNAGRWRLTARAGEPATASQSDDPADLALDVRELSAAYLGGTALTALADAGLVHEFTPGALASGSTAFTTARAPFCSWVF